MRKEGRDREQCERRVEELRDLLRSCEAGRGDAAEAADSRGFILLALRRQLEQMGRFSSALREYRRVLVAARREARRRPVPGSAGFLASIRIGIATFAARRGHRGHAMALFRAARRGLQAALRRWPHDEDLLRQLGAAGRRLADVTARHRGYRAARRTLESVVRELAVHAGANPTLFAAQEELADACCDLARLCEDESDFGAAESAFRRAAAIYRTLLHLEPDDDWRMALSSALFDLGSVVLVRDACAAEALYEEALRIRLSVETLDLLLAARPLAIAELCTSIGHAREDRGHLGRARAAYLRSFAAHEAVARRGFKGPRVSGEGYDVADALVDVCSRLILLAEDLGRAWEAEGLLRRGRAFVRRMAERRLIGSRAEREFLAALDSMAGA